MGGKELNFQIVYRGESLGRFINGGWVLFQRSKQSGGGYWLGRTYDGVFIIELERPTSLHEGIKYLMLVDKVASTSHVFDDDFQLEP
ncbi:hypothetical protein [Candidatus Pantoea soli]|uniref:LF-82 n=1 Tax=Candidatus Pantoea soli TaxID=3098669 RepID=A0A518XJX4_9GAMM|nr:hypothetical protein [Pantoea soli]QDY44494.1 hypothetical protein D8B20_21445 [Pantoea soli]